MQIPLCINSCISIYTYFSIVNRVSHQFLHKNRIFWPEFGYDTFHEKKHDLKRLFVSRCILQKVTFELNGFPKYSFAYYDVQIFEFLLRSKLIVLWWFHSTLRLQKYNWLDWVLKPRSFANRASILPLNYRATITILE